MSEAEADDRALRRVYVVVLAIPLVLVAALWTLVGATDTFRQVLHPAVAVVHGTLLVGLLTRRLSVARVGPWVVGSPATILGARLAVWELVPATHPADPALVIGVIAWIGVVLALAFLVLGTRRGAVVAVAGFAVVHVPAAWSAASGMLAATGSGPALLLVGAGHAALIAVVWVLARNVEQLAETRARGRLLELQATTDPLTGLANRRLLDDTVQHAIAGARRHGRPLAVVLVDLDHFKAVNDRFGHEAGDRALVATAAALRRQVRAADLVGRWGGEEFLLVAPDTDLTAALVLAERCRAAVAATSVPDVGDRSLTASLGVACLGPDDDARAVMQRADLALYAAKSQGRDRVVGLPPAPGPPAMVAGDHVVTRG